MELDLWVPKYNLALEYQGKFASCVPLLTFVQVSITTTIFILPLDRLELRHCIPKEMRRKARPAQTKGSLSPSSLIGMHTKLKRIVSYKIGGQERKSRWQQPFTSFALISFQK